MTFQPPQNNSVPSPPGWSSVPPLGGPVAPTAASYPPPYPPPGYSPVRPAGSSAINGSTKWIIGGLVAFLVVALVGVAGIVAVTTMRSGDKAGDAVQGYLQALAKGDAKKALSYGAGRPGSTELLTDEVLKRQIDKAPISEINILNDSTANGPSISMGSVHVSVRFGDKISDETLFLKKIDGKWKLDNAAVRVKSLFLGDIKSIVTVLGKPVTKDESVYIFPGWMGIEPLNSNYTVSTDEVATLKDLRGYTTLSTSSLGIKVTDTGFAAVNAAIRDAIAKCVQSTELAPANCPNKVREPGALPNSAKWAMPALPASWGDSLFSEYRMQLRYFANRLEFPVALRTADGPKQGSVRAYMIISADVTQSPPAISFS